MIPDKEPAALKEYFWMIDKPGVEKVGIAVDPKIGLDTIDFEPDEDF